MRKNKEQISQLFSEYRNLFTPEEEAILIRSEPEELQALYRKKSAEVQKNAALANILTPALCDHDSNGSEVSFFRLFSSVKNAKSRLLYAQSVSILKCPPTNYTRRSNLDSYLLAYTLQGQGVLEYQGRRSVLKSGDAFLIDCRVPHFYCADSPEGWEYAVIHFNGLNMPEFFSAITDRGVYSFSFSADSPFAEHLQALYDACGQLLCNDFTINMLLTCLLTDLINVSQTAQQAQMPAWLEQAISHINLHFTEDITLEMLAQTVNISKYYLSREFKQYTGQTVNTYLRSVRINAAKGYLTNTTLPVSVVAEMVGYQSQYHFISLFKEYEGRTPLQYRKQWRSSPDYV